MATMRFAEAIDRAVEAAMAEDPRVIILGEDVHMLRAPLFARFGKQRVLPAPISEAAFVGAAVGAAMAGLRPIVEVMLVDFIGVAMDAVLNHMAKLESFSGGSWRCPLVVRAACGGGYGDGGQHEQALWGLLAGIPGLSVVVPSTPVDAAAAMKAAISQDGPVIFLEHKLLAENWLEWMGRGGRDTVDFDVPAQGARGEVPTPLPDFKLGQAAIRRVGDALSIVSLAVGVHRAIEAAERLAERGLSCEVIDLRTVRPLDRKTLVDSVAKTGRLLVVDEDYEAFGLSGEIAAVALEEGLTPRYARVCVTDTLPYARALEERALPNTDRIITAAEALCSTPHRSS